MKGRNELATPFNVAELIPAWLLSTCLCALLLLNLRNLWRFREERKTKRYYAELPRPRGLIFSLTALGTLIFWAEAFLYPILVFSGGMRWMEATPLQARLPHAPSLRWVGLFMMMVGFVLLGWSILARGRYATSWEMPEDQRLVTWGPYRFVRHPSYLGYFLLFMGLPLLWPNFVAVFPLIAIPGYIRAAEEEERLLAKRFGEEYRRYQRRTGRFLPKFRRDNEPQT